MSLLLLRSSICNCKFSLSFLTFSLPFSLPQFSPPISFSSLTSNYVIKFPSILRHVPFFHPTHPITHTNSLNFIELLRMVRCPFSRALLVLAGRRKPNRTNRPSIASAPRRKGGVGSMGSLTIPSLSYWKTPHPVRVSAVPACLELSKSFSEFAEKGKLDFLDVTHFPFTDS